jgi:glutamate synthase (NADPH/NADH) large chain
MLERGEKMQLTYAVRNTMRAVGARTSSAVVRKYGQDALPEAHLHLQLKGAAGQSLGAFSVRGLKIELVGEANDYVGKGLSGATIVVRPPEWAEHQALIGNTTLYGATSGRLFVSGAAGERFAVRNSGAEAVVEGVGAHGCEYMTGGAAVILGPVGWNFAAGMTGGVAWVWDAAGTLERGLNPESVELRAVEGENAVRLRALVETHAAMTGSPLARRLLEDWQGALEQFVEVAPRREAVVVERKRA